MQVITLIKLMHLLGLILGMGGAVAADLVLLRLGILRQVRDDTVATIEMLSKAVAAGLALLWISGIMLVWIRTAIDPAFLDNPKLWSKYLIVGILTVNGFAVHLLALPRVKSHRGRRMFDLAGPREIAGLSLIAAVSSVSWFAPFVLGVASELNFTTPAWTILGFYATAVAAAWCAIFAFAFAVCRRNQANYWQPRIDFAREVRIHPASTAT